MLELFGTKDLNTMYKTSREIQTSPDSKNQTHSTIPLIQLETEVSPEIIYK